jgi:hypothetical protein
VLGDLTKSCDYNEMAIAVMREIGHRRGESNALWNLATTLKQLGRRDDAITHAEASLKIKEAIEDPFAPKVRTALEEWKSEK